MHRGLIALLRRRMQAARGGAGVEQKEHSAGALRALVASNSLQGEN